MRVVVTGAGGFVGGFVARRLAACGCEVTAISRRPGGDSHPSLTWRQADLGGADATPERFDALVHCAVDVPGGDTRSESVYGRNMAITRNVFDAALRAGAGSVVFLSSMSAYGAVTAPVVIEDLPPGELDPYGRAKRDGETLVQSCVERGLASGLSLRLPGTVGRGSHGNFLSVALKRVLAGETIQAKNPDSLFNNIVYVGDLAAFLDSWLARPRRGYATTNLGADEPLPMREVLALLFRCSGRDERLQFDEGGKKPFLISLDRARSLGYRPATVKASVESFVRDCA